MTRAAASLTGHWSGLYAYPGGLAPSVAFNAWLLERAGRLSGRTSEPNSFAPAAGRTLSADLAGTRSPAAAAFVKTYRDVAAPAVSYRGTISPDGLRIEGLWTIPAAGAPLTGSFVMVRTGGLPERAATGAEERAPR